MKDWQKIGAGAAGTLIFVSFLFGIFATKYDVEASKAQCNRDTKIQLQEMTKDIKEHIDLKLQVKCNKECSDVRNKVR